MEVDLATMEDMEVTMVEIMVATEKMIFNLNVQFHSVAGQPSNQQDMILKRSVKKLWLFLS